MSSNKRWRYLIYLPIAMVGVLIVLWLTRDGPGVSGDAVHYMDGAQNMLAGHGYARSSGDGTFRPISGFPPAFSTLLALFMVFTGDMLQAGRWLNAILFGLNIFLMGSLGYRLSRSWFVGLLCSLFALGFRDMILIHAWIMSEALYIALTLTSLFFLLHYWEQHQRLFLFLAALAAGISVLTRYVGLALVGAVGIGLLLFTLQGWKHRAINVIWFGLFSLLPFLTWLGRNSLVAGNLTARETAYHAISRDMWVVFADEISSWFVPNDLHFAWRPRLAIFGLVCLVGLILYLREWLQQRNNTGLTFTYALHLQSVIGIFMTAYLAVIFVNLFTLDASTSQVGLRRYLLPLFCVMMLWMLTVFAHALKPRLARLAVGLIAVSLWGVYGWGAINFIRAPGFVFGYTDVANASPEIVAALKAIDPQRSLISNDYEAIFFLAGRPPYGLPNAFEHFTGIARQEQPDYLADMQKVEDLLQQGAVLVAYGVDDHQAINALTPKLVRWKTFNKLVLYVDPDFAE